MNFVVIDDETIRNDLLTGFEAVTGEALKEGDARRIFLEQFAVSLVAQYNGINSAGKMNLLQFANGDYIDAIGARWGQLGLRLPAQKAVTTLLFTLSAIQAFNVVIPKGTRGTTADSSLFFAITEDLTITAGATTGTVTAEATSEGEIYNGLGVGLINRIVDPVPYVLSVSNTTTSQGGADVEIDDNYRIRLYLVSSAPSTAGSLEGYTFWTLKADSTIADVSVVSPAAGAVTLTILLENGQVPDTTVLDKVEAIIDIRRPLTDLVTVQAPTATEYAITFTYYINAADTSQVAVIQANVTTAVNEYIAWQQSTLGRDINPDELRKRVLNAGANRMTIISPTLTAVGLDKYAKNTTVTLTYGGVE